MCSATACQLPSPHISAPSSSNNSSSAPQSGVSIGNVCRSCKTTDDASVTLPATYTKQETADERRAKAESEPKQGAGGRSALPQHNTDGHFCACQFLRHG